jgi:hypothetical protein
VTKSNETRQCTSGGYTHLSHSTCFGDLKCFARSSFPVFTTFLVIIFYLFTYFVFVCYLSVCSLCDSDVAEACVARLLVRSLRVATGRSVPLHFWESVDPAPAAAVGSGRQAQQHAEKPAPKQPTQVTSSVHRDANMHPAPQAPPSTTRPRIQNADLSTVLKRL